MRSEDAISRQFAGKAFLVHVDADAHDRVAHASDLRVQFGENPAELFPAQEQIVGPANIGLERGDLAHRFAHRETGGERKPENVRGRDAGAQQDADVEAGAASGVPAMGSPAAPGGLLVGQIDHALRSALLGLPHGQHIGGVDGREVANVAGKGSAGQRGVRAARS